MSNGVNSNTNNSSNATASASSKAAEEPCPPDTTSPKRVMSILGTKNSSQPTENSRIGDIVRAGVENKAQT